LGYMLAQDLSRFVRNGCVRSGPRRTYRTDRLHCSKQRKS
jgi:hypothetical protein